MSESQLVRSHPLPPTRTAPQYATTPNPDPRRLTLIDPLVALLLLISPLSLCRSLESAVDLLPPCRTPAVTEIRALPNDVWPAWHCNDVSDAQAVTSHAVRPSLIDPVMLASPIHPPYTLKLIDPVPAELPRRSTLPKGMPAL